MGAMDELYRITSSRGLKPLNTGIRESCSSKRLKLEQNKQGIGDIQRVRNVGDLEVWLLAKNKPGGYEVTIIKWVQCRLKVHVNKAIVKRKQLLNHLQNNGCNVVLLNASIHKDKSIYIHNNKNSIEVIEYMANKLRSVFESKYGTGTDLCGYCIQASEMLQAIYSVYGIQSKTVEGWCEYDDDSSCSDRPYDEHTWLEIPIRNQRNPLYVDITADQFNTCMYRENRFSGVIINRGLPHGMCYDEPEGWNEDGEE